MSLDDHIKPKKQPQGSKRGLRETLEGVMERLRETLEDIAKGLNPVPRQPAPIPIPANRARRR